MTRRSKFLAFVLGAVMDRELADGIVGDLLEEGQRHAPRSPLRAALWVSTAASGVFTHAAMAQLRGAFREVPVIVAALGRSPLNLRPAVRSLTRTPWYTATTIAVVALGMMLATSVFAVVHGALLRSLPYPRAHELYVLSAGYSDDVLSQPGVRVINRTGLGLSWADVADIRAAVPDMTVTALPGPPSEPAIGSLGPTLPGRSRIDQTFFATIESAPVFGGFVPEDFSPTTSRVTPVLISHALWTQQFGGRRDVLGQTYAPAGDGIDPLYRVAGVLPEGFTLPSNGRAPDLLLPLAVPAAQVSDRRARQWSFLVRLPHADRYHTLLETLAVDAARGLGDTKENGGAGPTDRFSLTPLSQWMGRAARATSQQVFSVAVLLVFLACLNVSGLVTMRNVDRDRELALRRALGARTADIAASVLVEGAVLVGTGVFAGVTLAVPLVAFTWRMMPAAMRTTGAPSIDAAVLAFAALATVVTIGIVATGTIWRARRAGAAPLRSGTGRSGIRSNSVGRVAVVTGQVALAVLVTLCGALVVGSLVRASVSDLGMSADGVVVMTGTIPFAPPAAPPAATPGAEPASAASIAATRALLLDDFLRELRALPAVSAAGATSAPILTNGSPGGTFVGDTYAMTEGFHEALQLRLIAGRWPTPDELRTGANVILVTPDAAARAFQGRPPLGEVVTGGAGPSKESMLVIGVVERARYGSWDWNASQWPQSYVPYRHATPRPGFTIVVQTAREEDLLAWAGRRARDRSSPIRLTTAARANDLLDTTRHRRRFESGVFAAFTLAALVIVGTGILGLVAMTSARRRQEIGIRMALGATRRGIIHLLLREQARGVIAGLVLGGLVGLGAERWIQAYIYGLKPGDLLVWASTAGVVAIVSLVGIAVPAVRTSRVDPVDALRAD